VSPHILSHANLNTKRSYSTCFPPAVPLVHLACQISLFKVPITTVNNQRKVNGPFVYTLLIYELDLCLICQKKEFAKILLDRALFQI